MKDKYKIIHKIIKWRDASGLRSKEEPSEWFYKEEAIKSAKELWSELCETSGWVIYEDKEIIVIATTRSGDVYSDVTMIPKSLIVK